jgi:hypothetical protein
MRGEFINNPGETSLFIQDANINNGGYSEAPF